MNRIYHLRHSVTSFKKLIGKEKETNTDSVIVMLTAFSH